MQSLTDTEVIARLSRENEALKAEVADLKEGARRALLQIICIGGPLNDNSLRYTREQLLPFVRIAEALE